MSEAASTPKPELLDAAEALNGMLDGWNTAMGVRFVTATSDEVVAQLTVGPMHRQPYGIVHGGVYAGLIETVTSVAAALAAMPRGQSAVGLENHTSFVHAVREGVLKATARPITRGRRSQLWEATVTDENGRVAAIGRVRLLALDEGSAIAGETVGLRESGA